MQKERARGPLFWNYQYTCKAFSLLSAGDRCSWGRLRRGGGGFHFFNFLTIDLLASLADINAALEEGAIFDGDAGGHDIAGERAVTADIHTVAGGQVAAHFSENDNLAGVDVGRDDAVASDGHAIAGQVDRTFNASVNVKRFRSGHLAFDDERFADRCLVRSRGGGGKRAWHGRRFTDRRSRRGHTGALLFYRPRRRGIGLIGWFPHDG